MWVVVNVSSLYGAEDSCGRVQFPRCGQPVVFYLEHVHFLRWGGLLYACQKGGGAEAPSSS